MKRRFNRAYALLLCILLLLGTAPAAGLAGIADVLSVTAAAETYSGECGYSKTDETSSDVIWTLHSESGVLTISGTGDMNNYDYFHMRAPWYSVRMLIKSVMIGNGVTTVGDYAFYFCENLESVSLPNGICYIGAHAFSNCERLESVKIPGSVTSIGEDAFSGCTSLANVELSGGLRDIGGGAFSHSGLTSITIPDSVTDVGDYAFKYCNDLKNAVLSKNMMSFAMLFYNCENLESVVLPDGLKVIDFEAFCGCESLSDVVIPDSVTLIRELAFDDCKALKKMNIPKGVADIEVDAFYNCPALSEFSVHEDNKHFCADEYGVLYDIEKTTLIQYPIGNVRSAYTIPDTVITVSTDAFARCKALSSVTIGNLVESIGEAAFNQCSQLSQVKMGKSVKTIEPWAFSECSNLESLTLPNSLTSIGDDAFFGSGLMCVILPDSIMHIGISAFFGCYKLEYAHIPSSIKTISADIIEDPFYKCEKLLFICSDSAESSAKLYADQKGIEFRVCEGHEPPHIHEYSSVVTTEPTCAKTGVRTYTCAECGDSYTETIDKLPHTPQIVTEPATCTAEGKQYEICAVCSETLSEITVLQKTDHTPAAAVKENETPATCTEAGKYDEVVYCKDCGTEMSRKTVDVKALGHSFTNYVYNNDATTEKDGTKTAKCDRCDETDTVTAPGTKIVPTVAIRSYTQSKTVDYRTTITFSAEVTNPVSGAAVHWFINGQDKGAADTYTEKEAKATYTVQTKYIKDGKVLAESETETVNVKT
ncbi:MAG: leucine-rich repeat domain-containing protein, partial [Clostridia bacterium]|nr:leucine-rich repeat domain-containing protein [Clostridia bacterium]